MRDPDGNEWEVFVVLEDNLAENALCECGNNLVDEKADEKIAESCCIAKPILTESKSQVQNSCC